MVGIITIVLYIVVALWFTPSALMWWMSRTVCKRCHHHRGSWGMRDWCASSSNRHGASGWVTRGEWRDRKWSDGWLALGIGLLWFPITIALSSYAVAKSVGRVVLWATPPTKAEHERVRTQRVQEIERLTKEYGLSSPAHDTIITNHNLPGLVQDQENMRGDWERAMQAITRHLTPAQRAELYSCSVWPTEPDPPHRPHLYPWGS